jgi:predicted membrane protein
MFGMIRRVLSLALLAWFGFVLYSVATAVRRKAELPSEPPAADADDLRLVTVFEELNFKSTAHALRHASVETRSSGGILDLRDATLDPAGATLEVTSIFGGGQLIVPETWRISTDVKGIGGVGDARPARDLPADAPHLTIEGLAMFGGWGITSEAPERPAADVVQEPVAPNA